jgi:hypothetical protein
MATTSPPLRWTELAAALGLVPPPGDGAAATKVTAAMRQLVVSWTFCAHGAFEDGAV